MKHRVERQKNLVYDIMHDHDTSTNQKGCKERERVCACVRVSEGVSE